MQNLHPDPRYYNLTEDFIFIDEEWGSLFYKYIGEMNKSEAEETCSNFGTSVHLPLPRFSDEYEFYRNHFGDKNLWLDLTYNNNTGGFQTSSGHSFMNFNEYGWMNFNLTTKSIKRGVTMTKNGQWLSTENSDRFHSVCVFNIPPSRNCIQCLDKEFCRFKDNKRQQIQCVCPTKAEHLCKIDFPVETIPPIPNDADKRLEMFKGRL